MPWYLSPRLAQRIAQRSTEGLALLAGAGGLALTSSGVASHVVFSGVLLLGQALGVAA